MKTVGWLLILCCATSLIAVARGEQEGTGAWEIRALELAWVEAQARNDTRTLDALFDNDLVYLEHGRLVSKQEYLSQVRTQNPALQQIVMGPMAVRTFGSTAIVVGTYIERNIKPGKSVQKHWRFVDTWVYKKKWILVAAAAAPVSR